MTEDRQLTVRPNLIFQLFLITLILLTPTALTVGLMAYYTDATVGDLVPILSDEILYWHQAATFVEAGFNGGYYTEYERIPAADFTHYYAWGPFIPMIYGTLGSVFGWHLNSMAVINLVLYTLALGVFIGIVRPSTDELVLLLALTLTFIPFWLFSHRSLIEVMNQSFAILLAAFYVRLLKQSFSWWEVIPFALVMIVAASVRVTWVLALLPFFVLMARGRHWTWILVAPVITLVILYPALSFIGYVAAPFEDFLTQLFAVMEQSTAEGMAFLTEHLARNWWAGIYGQVPERSVFLQFFALSVFYGGVLIVATLRKSSLSEDQVWEAWFHVANLPVIFAGIYLAYDTFDWRGMRTLSPHLLMSLMVLVGLGRRWLVWGAVSVFLMATPATLVVYQDWVQQHITTEAERVALAETQLELSQLLVYEPEAPAWCNTVTYDPTLLFFNAPSLALALPAGMGLSGASEDDTLFYRLHDVSDYRLHSKYVVWIDGRPLFSDAIADLTLIGRAGGLSIYINNDSGCAIPAEAVTQEN